MIYSIRPKAVFTYVLQIWITVAMSGPLIYLVWHPDQFKNVSDWIGYELGITLYSLVYSIPGMLLFSGMAAFLFTRRCARIWKKSILAIWCIPVTMTAFWILFNTALSTQVEMFPGSICYIIPSFIGVWLYSWPDRMK